MCLSYSEAETLDLLAGWEENVKRRFWKWVMLHRTEWAPGCIVWELISPVMGNVIRVGFSAGSRPGGYGNRVTNVEGDCRKVHIGYHLYRREPQRGKRVDFRKSILPVYVRKQDVVAASASEVVVNRYVVRQEDYLKTLEEARAAWAEEERHIVEVGSDDDE